MCVRVRATARRTPPGRAGAEPRTTNADDKVPELYKQIADETGVEILRDLRSHSWRATLHGVYADVMDARTRADIFGHTEQIADEYYNDRANVEALIRATAQARS